MSFRSSYVDGVPLVLNKKFYPVPKEKYKELECHIPLDAFDNNYDFNLERQVLLEFEHYAKEKEDTDLRRKEALQQREERAKKDAEEAAEKAKRDAEEAAEKAKLAIEAAAEKAASLVREYEEEMAKQQRGFVPTTNNVVYNSPQSDNVSASMGTTETSRISSPETIAADGNTSPVSEGSPVTSASVSLPPSSSTMTTPQTSMAQGPTPMAPPPYQEHSGPMQPQPNSQPVIQQSHHPKIDQYDQQRPVMNFTPRNPPFEQPVIISSATESHSAYYQTYSSSSQPNLTTPTSSSHKIYTKMSNINLSDFETDTTDPFHSVELKSLNDMAVLASVLQNDINAPQQASQGMGLGSHSNSNIPTGNLSSSAPTSAPYPVINAGSGMDRRPMPQSQMNGGPNQDEALPFLSSYLSQNFNNRPAMNASSSYNTWTGPNPYYNHTHLPYRPTGVLTSQSVPTDSITTPLTSVFSQVSSGPAGPTSTVSANPALQDRAVPSSHPIPPNQPGMQNFGNYYFPYTSGQAQSRITGKDREYT